MPTTAQLTLFTWKEIENLAEIPRLKMVLESMPDEGLMVHVEATPSVEKVMQTGGSQATEEDLLLRSCRCRGRRLY